MFVFICFWKIVCIFLFKKGEMLDPQIKIGQHISGAFSSVGRGTSKVFKKLFGKKKSSRFAERSTFFISSFKYFFENIFLKYY